MLALVVYPTGVCNTWLATDWALLTRLCSEVMPVLAACRTCTPLPIPSSRLLMSLERLFSDCAVKKLVGLSSAELTLLPVARRFWVVESRSAVDCSDSKFWRTDAVRTIPDIVLPFWLRVTPIFSIGRLPNTGTKSLKKHESECGVRGPGFAYRLYKIARKSRKSQQNRGLRL